MADVDAHVGRVLRPWSRKVIYFVANGRDFERKHCVGICASYNASVHTGSGKAGEVPEDGTLSRDLYFWCGAAENLRPYMPFWDKEAYAEYTLIRAHILRLAESHS